jgi:Large eukaryotic DNA virus major capsid protein/Major capsid protein N-terminus
MSTRPRGDITTVLDLADRNAQDDFFFPLNAKTSWFHREPYITYPTTMASQEFTHKGAAAWGGRLTFELGALQAGDVLQSLILQIRLGSWYDQNFINQLATGAKVVDASGTDPATNPWTYINSLGSCIVDYAEFEVGDQTLERIDGQFIKLYSSVLPDANMLFGFAADGYGITSFPNVATNSGSLSPQRPWPTQDGVYFCLLPFFFMRTRLKETFPLVSCVEGSVRVHVQLRPFSECVRSTLHARSDCLQTPLGGVVRLVGGGTYQVGPSVPAFQDFRVLTYTGLVDGSVRSAYIHKPFEMMSKFVTRFHFDEPYKYLGSKTNSNTDTVEISLPLELNHPCQEILWVFRRKAVAINNEWANFQPIVESQFNVNAVPKAWLDFCTLRINGLIVEQADGEWWRRSIAKAHRGGYTSWANYTYGYSFAENPDDHQPSGAANMSRAASVRLDLRVNVPKAVPVPGGFDVDVGQGWEVFVYAIHLNWLRFENGLCQKLFED